jgi:hypothetical protein
VSFFRPLCSRMKDVLFDSMDDDHHHDNRE